MKQSTILWIVIWVVCGTVDIFCGTADAVWLAGLGTLIWWNHNH